MRVTRKTYSLRAWSLSLALIFLTAALPGTVLARGRGGGHPGHPGGGHPAPPRGGGHHYSHPRSNWYWGAGWGPYWGSGWGWGWGPFWGTTVVYGGPTIDTRRFAVVDTDISPEAAEIYLNGKYIGTADDFDGYPGYLYLRPGTYGLEFRHPAYEPLKLSLKARRGEKYDFDQELKLLPGQGKLSYFDPPDRGTPLGRVFGPDVAGSQTGTEGEEPEQFKEESSTSEPPPPRMDVRAAVPEKSRLRFRVLPEDAVIYLDDRYAGEGRELMESPALRVKPGLHRVTAMRPGYRSKTVEIDAKPGEITDVSVELEKGD